MPSAARGFVWTENGRCFTDSIMIVAGSSGLRDVAA
jgi:hypothetical protein